MKLTTQYSRVSMLITIGVLVVGGLIYYLVISYISDQQIDSDLMEEIREMNEFIEQHQRFPRPFEFDNYEAVFKPIGQKYYPPAFSDTVLRQSNGSKISGRTVIATVTLKNSNYRMVIATSKEGTNNLIQVILLITFLLVAILFLALFFANKLMLARLWKPFYELISRLQSFSLTGQSGERQSFIKVDEFNTLQTAIDTMAEKSIAEYNSLKVFTENASHEMMTPIAVITSKLDSLIQDESLTENQLQKLQVVYNAGNKLARLNQSLLLLVKIDHQLIEDNTEIDLKQCVADKLKQLSEIAEENEIVISASLENKKIRASLYLIDILLNNLVGNAIRHNHRGGTISVTLNDYSLIISNTGYVASLDETKIFERFEKSPASEGTGLGLTIAKNICAGYGFSLNYSFQKPDIHSFNITF